MNPVNNSPSNTTISRDYFQHVMTTAWAPRQAASRPYANNIYWQRKYRALQQWIAQEQLIHGRVLEVGCGTGLLQNVVPNYVGVDIATTSATYLRKPFGVCSATNLPFTNASFDAAFSIWMLEHIDQPEAVLAELRRVVRPGGTVFLVASYDVAPWIAEGLHRRPFRDLNLRQRLIKLSIPLRSSAPYRIATTLLRRSRDLPTALSGQPTRLRYGRLKPNFTTYWDYDADACVALDAYNVALYFLSRGDEPLYPTGKLRGLLQRSEPQIYRIKH